MTVTNVCVYDLDASIIASGYPARTECVSKEVASNEDVERAVRLSRLGSSENQAHEQFLTGIRVAFDLTCTNKMWVEAERYRFLEFVSSQSTMHCIQKFDIRSRCIDYVDSRVLDIIEEKKQEYIANPTTENFLGLIYNTPAGFQLTARLTTNYRCLKNIYKQRKNHRLPEWREFCKWIETLPLARELIVCEADDVSKSCAEDNF